MFALEAPTSVAVQDVRGKMAAIRDDLPEEIETPLVQRFDPDAQPIISSPLRSRPALARRDLTELAD